MESPLTLLLVEDDLADARLITRAMQKAGIPARVIHVKNGDEAVAYLSGQPPFVDRYKNPLPRLVLMDLKLPRRSGVEVLAWMREQKSAVARIPVVMLTSSHHAEDIRTAYDYGVNSYLVKPETTEHLLRLMASLKDYWFTHNQAPIVEPEKPSGVVP